MSIVKVEKRLSEVLGELQLEGLDKLFFGYGDKAELDAVLVTKTANRQKIYPLLWYVMPNPLNYDSFGVSGSFKFVLAHNTKADWFNDQRFDQTFDIVLYPYLERIITAIDKSMVISFKDEKKYSFTNAPNYSNASLTKNKQVDFWDAISLEMDLMIYAENEC